MRKAIFILQELDNEWAYPIIVRRILVFSHKKLLAPNQTFKNTNAWLKLRRSLRDLIYNLRELTQARFISLSHAWVITSFQLRASKNSLVEEHNCYKNSGWNGPHKKLIPIFHLFLLRFSPFVKQKSIVWTESTIQFMNGVFITRTTIFFILVELESSTQFRRTKLAGSSKRCGINHFREAWNNWYPSSCS